LLLAVAVVAVIPVQIELEVEVDLEASFKTQTFMLQAQLLSLQELVEVVPLQRRKVQVVEQVISAR
jgi:hypothetical protein